MTNVERKSYVIVLSAAFLMGYALISLLAIPGFFFLRGTEAEVSLLRGLSNTISTGASGGYCLASAISALYWLSYFIKRKAKWFQVLATILFVVCIKPLLFVSFSVKGVVYLYHLLRVLWQKLIA
ncbi:hypothetical protein [Enterococcus pallens]|uniref:Uncharacterized protein n=1 Tax=Enterococcus pallens ATCC BAA-351 TaxID=1158607 RepID=R2SDX1_9ENTE|nr:hypothetical protein [Enterococcus pallens]EOH93730.1 hypothetical protein UAU_02426 [Enterococcus pallens ATCC BAA-351]EOU24570.1 hypothetical protein I588_00557 [Enterococcus pallens ATCC BAA-351]OJG78544.1 hypothetical protein RV10_GL001326 [Enterococcus pallens]